MRVLDGGKSLISRRGSLLFAHFGLSGPVILDVITRALRDRGLPTTLLYGVDDMDPMDAQALLTPDAVEREMGLGDYVQSGSEMQASVSADLLQTIFTPYSPLHDGAVVIRGDQIVAAGAILPLTQFPVADKSIGTRHRAALGLSEETDALVIVVSEETSMVSVATRGQLERGVDRERLLEMLFTGRRSVLASAE